MSQNGDALHFVLNQTPEICIAAVNQNGFALRYVLDQTQEICKAAVTQNARALEYVKTQDQTICQLAYQQSGKEILKWIDFDQIKIEEIIGKVETRTIEINVINKIIYKDLQTGQSQYLDKKNSLYETVLDHISLVYGAVASTDIENLFERKMSADEILKDDNITGLYLIKTEYTYELYGKTIEMKNNGWLRDNLIPEVKTVKLIEYFEPRI